MDYFFGPFFDKGKSILTNIAGLEENQQTLMRKKEELSARESDVKSIISQAEEEEQGKRPTEESKLWLRNVEQFKGEVEDIINQISSSNFHSNARLAQTVAAKIEEADSLLKRCQLPNSIVIDQSHLHGEIIFFEPPSLCGQTTSERTMDKIMELLMKPEIRKIGVYGVGGVGKSTIMKNIYNKLMANADKPFHRIIWVTVTKDMGGIEGLQNKIALELRLEFGNEHSCLVKRAAVLLKKLKRAKRFLLILDDLWEKITLEEIGIPDPDREGNDCKIVVTTRLRWVCNFIETHRNVKVKCLSEEEAWKLFVSKTGDHVLRVPEITSLARDVVRKLEGLPLAISTVGCAMRRKCNAREWRRTLKALRSSTEEEEIYENELIMSLEGFTKRRRGADEYDGACDWEAERDNGEMELNTLETLEDPELEAVNEVAVERPTKRKRVAEEYDGTCDWQVEMDEEESAYDDTGDWEAKMDKYEMEPNTLETLEEGEIEALKTRALLKDIKVKVGAAKIARTGSTSFIRPGFKRVQQR